MKVSIELTKDQYREMKAMVALQGKTINQFILEAVTFDFGYMESRKSSDFRPD